MTLLWRRRWILRYNRGVKDKQIPDPEWEVKLALLEDDLKRLKSGNDIDRDGNRINKTVEQVQREIDALLLPVEKEVSFGEDENAEEGEAA